MTKKKSRVLGVFLLLLLLNVSCKSTEEKNTVLVVSPNGHHSIVFELNGKKGPFYRVTFKGTQIIAPSILGFSLKEGVPTFENTKIETVETNSVNTTWKPVYGEKNEYPENYNEALVKLSGSPYNLRLRSYNEGVAFRYEFRDDTRSKIITKENTAFALPANATAWVSERAQGEIKKMVVSDIDSVAERPLLVQLGDSLFTAIGEAALVDFARMQFSGKSGKPGTLVSRLSSEVVLGDSVKASPWRFIMAGETPGQILENNYLVLNLNEPNKIEDTSYIRPGKIIRELTLGTEAGLACVDFAVKHNLQYIEFDAGWYGNEYDDASDATTVTVDPKRSKEELELQKVIDYASSKGIGVILYVNRRSLEKQLDDVLPHLKKWGVSGVKYGFVNVGSQKWTIWLHDAIRKAADNELMVDVHDSYRPTGFSRTYPNLMTQEGIRGDEESPGNEMVINTIFTRMIAGAGDQTNCYFASRVTEKMGSHASQLAKALCIYSPWQFLYWYDRPKGAKAEAGGAGGSNAFIEEVDELAWFDALPTVWDDTKVLGGYPGEYAIIARKNGSDWFVGALSGQNEKEIRIVLDFLEAGKTYEAILYTDDINSNSITKVAIEKRMVNKGEVIEYKLLAKNGLAIHLKPIE